MSKLLNANDLLSLRYGEEGSIKREKFKEDALAYYFGELIKNRRKELKLTQQDLATIVGKKRPYISRVENGEDIQLSNFAIILNALGISLEFKY
jgi:ribosome-binding protein aMBF1 (putative translation factor)